MSPRPRIQERFITMPDVSEENVDLILRDANRLVDIELRVVRTHTRASGDTKWVFYDGRDRAFWITFQPRQHRLWFSNTVCTVWKGQQSSVEERLTRAFKSASTFRRAYERIHKKLRGDPQTALARVVAGHAWDEP